MKIKPCDDYILVEPDELPETTAGGIVVPQTAKQARQSLTRRGTVLAVGPGRLLRSGQREPIQCKLGDRVVYEEHEGYKHAVDIEGATKMLRMIRESALLGIIEDEEQKPEWQAARAEMRQEGWQS